MNEKQSPWTTHRLFRKNSLGPSRCLDSVTLLPIAVAIGIGNMIVLKRALLPEGLSTTCVAIGICEVVAGFVWGEQALIALFRHLNWARYPGSLSLILVKIGMVAALVGKGIWTNRAAGSLSPSRFDGQVHLNLSVLILRDDVRLHRAVAQQSVGRCLRRACWFADSFPGEGSFGVIPLADVLFNLAKAREADEAIRLLVGVVTDDPFRLDISDIRLAEQPSPTGG